MSAPQIKALLILGVGGFLAIIMGFSLANSTANEDYTMLALAGYFVVGMIVLLFAENIPLTAFGLMSPLVIPMPLIWSFPFILIILGICTFKLILQRAISQEKPVKIRVKAVVWPFRVFFCGVLLRYIIDPALPNFGGFGDNVTGFRPYLTYFSSFYLLFLMGRLVHTRENVLSLIRWMTIVSFSFASVLSICVFTKSGAVAYICSYFGIATTLFDNGFLRFLALPSFGLFLVIVSLLPKLVPTSKFMRFVLFGLGMLAVLLGGNRVGLVMVVVAVICIPLSQGKVLQTSIATFSVFMMLLVASIFGNLVRGDVGLLRIFSLVNEQLETNSRADDSVRWRQVRWERAWQDIKQRPFIGHSYGGLDNAFIYDKQGDEETLDVDLASGYVHNGYLSCARAFGIPLMLFLVGILLWRLFVHFKYAQFYLKDDPQISQLNSFVFAYLAALVPVIGVGTDTNLGILWFNLGLGVVIIQIKSLELEALRPPKEPEPVTFHPIMIT